MEVKVSRLEVTNSRNDDVDIEWFFYASDSEYKEWIAKNKKKKQDWIKNPCAVSIIYYSYSDYTVDQLLEYPIEALKGMTLNNILTLVKLSK